MTGDIRLEKLNRSERNGDRREKAGRNRKRFDNKAGKERKHFANREGKDGNRFDNRAEKDKRNRRLAPLGVMKSENNGRKRKKQRRKTP